MSSTLTPIDISNIPVPLDLVEEVEATKKPRELKRDDKVVAVLSPVAQKEKDAPRPTKADWQKSLAAHVQGVRLNHTIFAREERPAMR